MQPQSAVSAGGNRKRIALTFDDGPTLVTDPVLDLLDKYRIKATFFVVGRQVALYPEKLKETYDRGHFIQAHSQSHARFSQISAAQMSDEIDSLNAQIERLGIPVPRYFRPPFGDGGDLAILTDLLDRRGMRLVYWTIGARDWQVLDANDVYRNVLGEVRAAWADGNPTQVLLFHDKRPHVPVALDMVLPELQSEGCEFVLIDEVA